MINLLDHVRGQGNNVLFVTGAGISASSGLETFRSAESGKEWIKSGLVDWNKKSTFLKNPTEWWTKFWLQQQILSPRSISARPSLGHVALTKLVKMLQEDGVAARVITQNIDDLHEKSGLTDEKDLIHTHGSWNLLRCLRCNEAKTSEVDIKKIAELAIANAGGEEHGDDTKKENDDGKKENDDERNGEGSDKRNDAEGSGDEGNSGGENATKENSTGEKFDSESKMEKKTKNIAGDVVDLLRCTKCGEIQMPLVLMFDEGYTAHPRFRFKEVQQWVEEATCIVFVGTSFSVGLTRFVLGLADAMDKEVFNINIEPIRKGASLFEGGRIPMSNCIVGTSDQVLSDLFEELSKSPRSLPLPLSSFLPSLSLPPLSSSLASLSLPPLSSLSLAMSSLSLN